MNLHRYLFVSLLLAVVFPACAQPPGHFALENVNPAQRAALVSNMHRGATFTSEGQSYQHLPDAQAGLARASESLAQARQRLNVNTSDIVDTKGRFVFYRAANGAPTLHRRGDEAAFPVVLNTSTGELGLLPGTITVTLRNVAQAGDVAADHGLTLERAFPHLGVAYFKVGDGGNVLAAAAAVAGDARVTRAEPEVIEHINVPR